MQNLCDTDYYIGNRQKLRHKTEINLIIITSHGLLQRASDTTFPFHQDSNFWYLTGIDEPDMILVMDGSDEYLIVPERSNNRETFDGAIDDAALSAISGITEILDGRAGWQRLTASLQAHKQVATLDAAPPYIDDHGMYTNPARQHLTEKIHAASEMIELVDCRQTLVQMRVIKQHQELAALQAAIDITIASIEELTTGKRFGSYNYEYEIEADLSREFRYRGSNGHAFAPIIAGGAQACTLHNVANNSKLDDNSLVVIDVGAEVAHYAADITRTKIYGTPTARQQGVFDAVLDVQQFALSLLKPGIYLKEYEQQVETYMGKTLQKLRLISTANTQTIRQYFPHSTSHFLGLDVHDVGDYSQPLQAGMVVTCEPGIYIPNEQIGVRIEDDILITDTGHLSLSQALPKTLQ